MQAKATTIPTGIGTLPAPLHPGFRAKLEACETVDDLFRLAQPHGAAFIDPDAFAEISARGLVAAFDRWRTGPEADLRSDPDPWRTCPEDWRIIEDANGRVVADVRVPGHEGGRYVAELLAAAPELERWTRDLIEDLASREYRNGPEHELREILRRLDIASGGELEPMSAARCPTLEDVVIDVLRRFKTFKAKPDDGMLAPLVGALERLEARAHTAGIVADPDDVYRSPEVRAERAALMAREAAGAPSRPDPGPRPEDTADGAPSAGAGAGTAGEGGAADLPSCWCGATAVEARRDRCLEDACPFRTTCPDCGGQYGAHCKGCPEHCPASADGAHDFTAGNRLSAICQHCGGTGRDADRERWEAIDLVRRLIDDATTVLANLIGSTESSRALEATCEAATAWIDSRVPAGDKT